LVARSRGIQLTNYLFVLPRVNIVRVSSVGIANGAPDDIPFQPQPYFLRNKTGLDFFLFARRYSGNKNFFYFPPLTVMFQFGGYADTLRYLVTFLATGFPHSDIPG
jgi:hypothetical protein